MKRLNSTMATNGGPTEDAAGPGTGGPEARRPKARLLKLALAVAVVAGGAFGVHALVGGASAQENPGDALTYTVRRGELTVSVTEGGVINAMKSLDIKSEVERQTRILSIVPEGTHITEEDVENGKVLVVLDSSELQEKKSQQEINFASAEAAYKQAQEAFKIQEKQNESNITLAKLQVNFARMDLQHYLGETLAEEVARGEAGFEELAGRPELGGAASQDKKKLENDVTLAQEELSRAFDRLEGTKRLVEKGYESASELEADRLAYKRRQIELEQARTALDLFLKYELPKYAEQFYSDYQEAQRELVRVEAKARSELAQAEAELKAKQAAFNLQKQRLDHLTKDIEGCTIRATKPGLVVYASTVDPRAFRDSPIEEGFMVRQRQTIITMPDMKTLAVKVNIHESDVEKIREGLPARVSVEALPGKSYRGHVAKISLLASSEHRWLNPDIMVYSTDVAIDDISPELKPGMSGTAEIIAEVLKDVIFVPIQAVTTRAGQRVCWVRTPQGPELRNIETGHFNDKYVVVEAGLVEGDEVFLSPPEGVPTLAEAGEEEQEREEVLQPPELEPVRPQPAAEEPKAEQEKPADEAQGRPEWSPERLKEMRERLEKMTPEERRKFMEGMRRRAQESGGRPSGD